ncbi:MAG: peptide chain release factor N(5)-glutamine methyltransferase [Bacteroidetes bacterium]|nr:MAG: peptide chain release factor N(5)-glutamine methyltransferase [Bacteroidota bacterium]
MQWKTNKLFDLRKQYMQELLAYYDQREAESLLTILVQYFFGLSQSGLITNADFRLSESEMLQLHFAVKDLKKYRPVQYIIGETEFFDLKIKVNKAVLIPRPETEELVQLIINNEKQRDLNILDIGTGSGCIAIALKKNIPFAQLTGIDISDAAIELASENAENNKLNIAFAELNILDQRQWNLLGQFDIIVSNPPYVTNAEKNRMDNNVLNYEPHQALFVADNDALVFYKAIFHFSENHLRQNGKIYFEINEEKGNEIVELAKSKNFVNVKLHKDINGKNRFVSGSKVSVI